MRTVIGWLFVLLGGVPLLLSLAGLPRELTQGASGMVFWYGELARVGLDLLFLGAGLWLLRNVARDRTKRRIEHNPSTYFPKSA
jgi:hypothetical protein